MSTVSIPAFHVSDISKVKGDGEVFLETRKDATSAGTFNVTVDVHFDPLADDYPTGTLTIKAQLTDGSKGVFFATSIELINSYGKHNPTVYLTGRCKADVSPSAKGCRFWVFIANNGTPNTPKTPDVIGFAVHDRTGARIAYGIGPLKSGNFEVKPK